MEQDQFERAFARMGVGEGRREVHTLLPDPEPREVRYTVISADDHLVEPPDLFDGRMPAAFQDRAPHVVDGDNGAQLWCIDGRLEPNVGMNAIIGRPKSEWLAEPTRFDEMRPGAWDIHQRVRDMDLNGVHASVNFPSFLAGFAGQRFSLLDDRDFGFALLHAHNDWHIDYWAGTYPDRIVPCQLPWLPEPEVAAREIYDNAERGFKAVTFPQNTEPLGLPSLYDEEHWRPFFRACEETETVICLHVGSSGTVLQPSTQAPVETRGILFPFNAAIDSIDWLFSGITVRHPNLKIVMAEGGIGWVPMLLDRLDHYTAVQYHTEFQNHWPSREITPSEVLQRNFWFCVLEDTCALELRDRISVDHILVESDYPHGDSTWPDTQEVLVRMLDGYPNEEIRKITCENAARLFRHPLPAVPLPN